MKKCKYSKRRRSNVAVIIVRVLFISLFLFYCLLLNHSFQTNPNRITNCFQLFSLLQLYKLHLLNASLFWFLNRWNTSQSIYFCWYIDLHVTWKNFGGRILVRFGRLEFWFVAADRCLGEVPIANGRRVLGFVAFFERRTISGTAERR